MGWWISFSPFPFPLFLFPLTGGVCSQLLWDKGCSLLFVVCCSWLLLLRLRKHCYCYFPKSLYGSKSLKAKRTTKSQVWSWRFHLPILGFNMSRYVPFPDIGQKVLQNEDQRIDAIVPSPYPPRKLKNSISISRWRSDAEMLIYILPKETQGFLGWWNTVCWLSLRHPQDSQILPLDHSIKPRCFLQGVAFFESFQELPNETSANTPTILG